MCAGCREHYIGQTEDTLRHQMTVHRQQILETKYQCTPISEHFGISAEIILTNFTVFPIYKLCKATTEKEDETKQ